MWGYGRILPQRVEKIAERYLEIVTQYGDGGYCQVYASTLDVGYIHSGIFKHGLQRQFARFSQTAHFGCNLFENDVVAPSFHCNAKKMLLKYKNTLNKV
jgi:hypothetical protein